MEKEFTFKVDLEQIRKELYNFIDLWTRTDDLVFAFKSEYKWFINNVSKRGIPILAFKKKFIEEDHKITLIINYTFVRDGEVCMSYLELVGKNTNFQLPKFEEGEN